MAAVDMEVNLTSAQFPINATAGQVVKVVLLNADGSQNSVIAELSVPTGKVFGGGFSIGGTVSNA